MFRVLLKYELQNIFRNKWVFGYSIFFFLLTELLYTLSQDSAKVFISLMNVMLIAIPLVSIIYGTQYIYNSREFIQVLLSQPIDRKRIFFSSYVASLIAVSGSFVIGTGIPLIFHEYNHELLYTIYVIVSGALLSSVFLSLAFMVAYKFDDKAKGLILSLIIWFSLSILYDGVILIALYTLRDFPIEYPALVLSIINPNDLARMLLVLNLDVSALMGYTGALYKDFFGTGTGVIVSFAILIVWILVPLYISLRTFLKKDF
jgi:Cu-processing system permease protein